jgi:hypothetical protein
MQTLIVDQKYNIQGDTIACTATLELRDADNTPVGSTTLSATASLADPQWPALIVEALRNQGVSYAADYGHRAAVQRVREAFLSPDATLTIDGAVGLLLTNASRQIQQIMTGAPVTPVEVPEFPAGTSIEYRQRRKEAAIRAEGARRMEEIALPYLPQERDTWPAQLTEAEAYLAAPDTAATPTLSAIAAGRAMAVADLVPLVMGNADLFRQRAGEVLGVQQRLIAQIWTATTPEEVEAITW